MLQCLNPNCLKQNPDDTKFCQYCRTQIILGNRYHPLSVIGNGGFGRTFAAVDKERLDTPCVIKQFFPQGQGTEEIEKAKELFKKEAERLRDLGKHPQIPDLFAFLEQEGRLYLVQEFIEGENLWDEFKSQGKFSETDILNLLNDLLPVLQFIHDNNVIHRDIKPDNIIINSQSQKLFIIDFGVSKLVSGTLLTRVGTVAGTPGYAAPEQLHGHAFPSSDLYSLAVTCIRLLTGIFPQKNSGNPQLPSDLLFNSMNMEWIWKKYVTVNKDLELVLDKMLHNFPVYRFQSATEVLEALLPQSNLPKTKFITPQPTNNPDIFQRLKQFISPPTPQTQKTPPAKIQTPQNITPPPTPQKPKTPPAKIQTPQIVTPPPPKIVTPQPKHQSFTENLGNGVRLEMIAIPEGTFLMGSPDGEGYNDEKPQHEITVPAFYMGKYPVTQAQWERVAGLSKVERDLELNPSHFQGKNLPVETVSWLDAQEFCARISKATGKVYRLPSEAEWEYACRAKTTTRYYFGDGITKELVNCNGWYDGTTEVGKFPSNNFGLYDMHGNVWEWSEDDWFDNYKNHKNSRARIKANNNTKLSRGGSWCNYDHLCCSAYRLNYGAGIRDYLSGFRLVCACG
jgi:formylglycine-generating enzyme required for sulfatase activity/tRNA A-37 threonylcarbamoyl transferase component Bud32